MSCLIPMRIFSKSLNPGTEITLKYKLRNQFGWSIESPSSSSSENSPSVIKEPAELIDIGRGDNTSTTSIHLEWLPFKALILRGGLEKVDYKVYWGEAENDRLFDPFQVLTESTNFEKEVLTEKYTAQKL